jgi:hypothetical protein
MPLYDLKCTCGWEEEDVLLFTPRQRAAARCPECEGELAHRIPVPSIGGTAPVTSLGQSFPNERAAEAYRAEHQSGSVVLEGTEKTKYIDRAREKAEAAARAMGYKDVDHRRADVRSDIATRQRLDNGGRKPFLMPK